MKTLYVVGNALALICANALAGDSTALLDKEHEKAAFIKDLMKRMTLEEKIGQLNLVSVGPDYTKEAIMADIRAGKVGAMFNTVTRPDIRQMQVQAVEHSRLHIPLLYAYDVIHGHRTVFPISLGMASSWDLDAIALSGRISAQEAAADGLNLTFSPTVDITREPRWGRVSETFGEDVYLTSRIAEVLVKAYQGKDLSAPDTIMASLKHFALYGAVEGGRDYNTVDMSPQRMFQDYLPPYQAAVNAGAGSVMVSLNAINGIPSTANKWLLKDVLREQWQFKGMTISDHGAVNELIKHGVAQNGHDAALLAIRAGVDLNMHDDLYGKELPVLLKEKAITPADIDEACRHVLAAKYDLGLFKDPYAYLGKADDPSFDTNAESRLHRDASRSVARKSMVLLKNERDLLPLKKQGTLAVIGPMAKSQRDIMGNWSAAGVTAQAVSVYQGLERATAGKAKLLYAKGTNVTNDSSVLAYLNSYDPSVDIDHRSAEDMIEEAVEVAKHADVIVAVVGESQGMAHEASSRADITIPTSQRDLLKALKATGKPLVLVLMNGRPLALEWENQQADAMLETWFSGTEGGNAVADVLFGDYNPSGKLPMTFPRSVGQVPMYYNHLNTGRPFNPLDPGKYTSRYFDEANGPLFPFGYGLSYTTFTVSDIALSSPSLSKNGQLTARVTVKNTGKRAGETVVQLYLRDVVASVSRPVKELKHFKKVMLQPGKQQEIEFTITDDDLKFYHSDLQYHSEPGDFNVYIGLDSANVKEQQFTLL
ncbi:beta-glucosidase [Pseudomonas duriflava]|uniref:Periplasmic beta-glucosidase n=1 Tax=Pseudomonas duriflava TaxID=459528 RepID=A0A562PSB3_9PSED|nr:beta-glucosidase BglX [Pseudomonas duriflava]TWI47263.1 beta-glucosidase [Pseudomonas duriflava]